MNGRGDNEIMEDIYNKMRSGRTCCLFYLVANDVLFCYT